MFKPSFLNIVYFIFIKYLVYYLAFVIGTYDPEHVSSEVSIKSIVYIILIMLPLPVAYTLFFSAPLYYSFRLKWGYFILIFLAVLGGEYFLFTYFTSQDVFDKYSILNAIITLANFVLFFFKYFPGIGKRAIRN
jgi:hypothetical protein